MPLRKWLRLLIGVAAAAALSVASLAGTGSAAAGTITAAGTAKAATTAAGGSAPNLWPKLAPFKTLTVADLSDGTSDEQLAAVTLEGAYNQRQGANRLYVVENPDNTTPPEDQTWLADGVLPKGDSWSALPGIGGGAAGQLDAMLASYGQDVKGAILINPSDPDTINLATTMAGIDDAMVADPGQLPLLQQYGIPVIYSFAGTTFASPAAAYQWEYANLSGRTNPRDLVILNPADYGLLRDYIVATRSFVFYLTTDDSSEGSLMNQIIGSRPANTPIMGYIADEQPDVAYLSSRGDFLNASDDTDNESDWAAVPDVPGLTQPAPRPVRAGQNTIYVAFMVSEGDNLQYVEHHMFEMWSTYPDMGDVPEGWTIAPGMADYAPSLISWYYRHLPGNSELLSGPSGVGYATQMSGSDLRRFAQLSGGFMSKDTMSTADFWENPGELAAYAKASGVPGISVDAPLAYTQDGQTAVLGQTSGYVDPASSVLSTIEQDALNQPGSGPVFLEPLVDAWNETPQNILAVAQALTSWGQSTGKNVVFTTPSELALTEEAYRNGSGAALPQLNAQAVSGTSLLALPSAGQLQGYTPPASVSGPNLVTNPGGQNGTAGWTGTAGTLNAGTYQGSPDIAWNVSAGPGPDPNPGDPGSSNQWAHVYPAVTNGGTYRFTVQVAGSGQVFMDVYNGNTDSQTQAVRLSSSYQTLTWVATIPAGAPTGQTGSAPQLQVRETGLGPVSVHIKNATVQQASSSS
ncbi:MAG: hypothetical protein ACRDN0_30745 [Trebonia sp.]